MSFITASFLDWVWSQTAQCDEAVREEGDVRGSQDKYCMRTPTCDGAELRRSLKLKAVLEIERCPEQKILRNSDSMLKILIYKKSARSCENGRHVFREPWRPKTDLSAPSRSFWYLDAHDSKWQEVFDFLTSPKIPIRSHVHGSVYAFRIAMKFLRCIRLYNYARDENICMLGGNVITASYHVSKVSCFPHKSSLVCFFKYWSKL